MTARDLIKASLKRLKKEPPIDRELALKRLNQLMREWNTPLVVKKRVEFRLPHKYN